MTDPTETLALLQHTALFTKISLALDVVLLGLLVYLVVQVRKLRRSLRESTDRLGLVREAMEKKNADIQSRLSEKEASAARPFKAYPEDIHPCLKCGGEADLLTEEGGEVDYIDTGVQEIKTISPPRMIVQCASCGHVNEGWSHLFGRSHFTKQDEIDHILRWNRIARTELAKKKAAH